MKKVLSALLCLFFSFFSCLSVFKSPVSANNSVPKIVKEWVQKHYSYIIGNTFILGLIVLSIQGCRGRSFVTKLDWYERNVIENGYEPTTHGAGALLEPIRAIYHKKMDGVGDLMKKFFNITDYDKYQSRDLTEEEQRRVDAYLSDFKQILMKEYGPIGASIFIS